MLDDDTEYEHFCVNKIKSSIPCLKISYVIQSYATHPDKNCTESEDNRSLTSCLTKRWKVTEGAIQSKTSENVVWSSWTQTSKSFNHFYLWYDYKTAITQSPHDYLSAGQLLTAPHHNFHNWIHANWTAYLDKCIASLQFHGYLASSIETCTFITKFIDNYFFWLMGTIIEPFLYFFYQTVIFLSVIWKV